jgi:hypothetical protein
MAHNEEIERELRSISGAVADLPANLPFTIPPDFFESFPARVLDLIRSNLTDSDPGELNSDLRDLPTFRVPAGYFDHLAEDVLKRIRLGEMKKLEEEQAGKEERAEEEEPLPAILAGLRELPTFRVPAGYFDLLPEQLTGLALVTSVADQNFDNGAVSSREEIHHLSPLLASLQGQYPGQVPIGYFERFPERTREALRAALPLYEQRAAAAHPPVIQMNGKLLPIRKFLAAAVTIGAVLLSAVWGYHIYDRPVDFIRSGVNIKTEGQFNTALAKLSDQDIVDYLGSNTDVSDADQIASEVEDNPEGIQAAPERTVDGSAHTGQSK